jgi:anti-sigma B factor antagonist
VDNGRSSKREPEGNFGVSIVNTGGEIVVAVSGEIDLTAAEELWQTVSAALTMSNRLVIDLTETTFMDSTALSMLARAYRELGQVPEAVTVRSPSPCARELLRISGLEHLLTIDDRSQV